MPSSWFLSKAAIGWEAFGTTDGTARFDDESLWYSRVGRREPPRAA